MTLADEWIAPCGSGGCPSYDPPVSDSSDLLADRLDRERRAHDELARNQVPADMPPVALSQLDIRMLELAGPVADKRVLDLGCGVGDLTLALVQEGAIVTAVDLSPGMVEVARCRVATFLSVSEDPGFVAAAAEDLPFASDSFDLIVGRFILHHLDLELAAVELTRVLAPGGVAVFVENAGFNRILMFARDHVAGRFGVPRLGTPDEQPLGESELDHLRGTFPHVALEFPVFDFFTILDRQVFRYRFKLISTICRWLDGAIWERVLPLRRYSFRTVVLLRNSGRTGHSSATNF